MQLPKTRTTGLVEQEADSELLVYDLQTSRAYTLNETSKNVFKACGDGETSFEELKRRHKYTDDIIYLALDELKKNNLVEGDYSSPFSGTSRREAIRKVGLASMVALPIVFGLTAPTAANAATCPASGNNIPSGCPVGTPISTGNSTCAGTPDSDRTAICNAFFRSSCQSGSARYAANTCSNSGSGTIYSCACS